MRTIIFITMLFSAAFSVAQTNYYTTSKVFYSSGYIYQCDSSDSRRIELYNVSNKWIGETVSYKSTGETFVMPDEGIQLTTHASWLANEEKVKNIVNAAFTAAQKQTITDEELYIVMYINTETGKIDDVYFDFSNIGPYAYIPVSVYRNIELAIKENVQEVLTDEGRKLNFIYWWTTVVPK
jgi:hypothetical protein